GGNSFSFDDFDGHQGELAPFVDVPDFDVDFLPDADDIFDVLNPLAAVHLADLRDVQQPVLAGQQRHEGPERGGLHDRAEVAFPDLGHGRVGDAVDGVAGGLRGRPVGGADVDGAVVLDGDFGAGLVLDRVDHLALGADDLADLVDRHLDRKDTRRVRTDLSGPVDGLRHDVEDGQPRPAGLLQRGRQHLGGDPVELGVQLQRGDEVARARDLEVHVTVGVFRTDDAGKGHVLSVLVAQAHGDTGHPVLARH